MPTRSQTSSKPSTTTAETMFGESQLAPLLEALQAAKAGDFSVRLPDQKGGILSQIYRDFNDVISLNENEAQEIVRVPKLKSTGARRTIG